MTILDSISVSVFVDILVDFTNRLWQRPRGLFDGPQLIRIRFQVVAKLVTESETNTIFVECLPSSV